MLPHRGRSPWAWQTPSRRRGGSKVVSMASCAQCHRVRPSATTSRRSPSKLLNSAKSMSRTWSLVVTRAAASLHTWAAATSNGETPLPRCTLDDDGQICQVGGDIGRYAWTEGGASADVCTGRHGRVGHQPEVPLTWGAQSMAQKPEVCVGKATVPWNCH